MFSKIILRNQRYFSQALNCNRIQPMSVVANYLQCNEFGDPIKVVQKHEVKLEEPKANEILVKILAAPINPADINVIQGKYGYKPKVPFIPGNECVAEILKCGSDVKNLQPGDRVVPYASLLGTWRTHAIYKTSDVFKVPQDIEIVNAATITVNPPTAYRMLKDFVELKPGDTVIQNGANSAVGQAVFQFCKIWGINCIGVVRDRPDIHNLKVYLKSLGATEVLTEEEIRVTLLFKSGQLPTLKLGLNCVGGKSSTNILRHLTDKGVLVTYGAMSREPLTIPASALIFKDISFRGYWMSRWSKENANRIEEMYNDLFKLMKSGDFKPSAHKFIPFSDYKPALEQLSDMKGMVGEKLLFDFSL